VEKLLTARGTSHVEEHCPFDNLHSHATLSTSIFVRMMAHRDSLGMSMRRSAPLPLPVPLPGRADAPRLGSWKRWDSMRNRPTPRYTTRQVAIFFGAIAIGSIIGITTGDIVTWLMTGVGIGALLMALLTLRTR